MPELRTFVPATQGETCRVRPDAAITALAERQHGVVARHQLLARGVSSSMIEARTATGLLIPLHRGVYAVGHRRLRREGFWLAAVLASGPGAVLSHRAAAAHHGIRDSGGTRVDVTTPRRGHRTKAGISVHRAHLDPRDTEILESIPVTTVSRTLVDLAGVVPRDSLTKAIRAAEQQRTLDLTAIHRVLDQTRNRPNAGHANMTAALADREARGMQLTRSVLEDRFLTLIHTRGLPMPETNVHVEGVEVDAYWRTQRLVVELDGWAHHGDRHAFEGDREKSNLLTEAGCTVLRFTHDAVVRRPAEIAARLARLLSA